MDQLVLVYMTNQKPFKGEPTLKWSSKVWNQIIQILQGQS